MKTAKLDYTNSSTLIIGLLLLSIVAFWQSYYLLFFESSFYVHFHAFTAIFWFALLIVQPYLIKKRLLDLHRTLGKISYSIAGLVIISILLLAHNKISTASESLFSLRTYVLYLQLSLAFVFAFTYGFAIYYRKKKPFMPD
ncbi:hypothetical protein [Gracilimonas sp.]|uniref:hypothetical protein n=1 Tax=Gracilimonas sp. TaxID=1974203 RepID=UPI002870CEAB|nr:hypothetical protein [Gracilimonas sp.]